MRQDETYEAFGSASINKLADLQEGEIKRYWALVSKVLVTVFHKKPADAIIIINNIKDKMDSSLSDDAQLLIYHSSPLETASDLLGLGKKPITMSKNKKYLDIMNSDRNTEILNSSNLKSGTSLRG